MGGGLGADSTTRPRGERAGSWEGLDTTPEMILPPDIIGPDDDDPYNGWEPEDGFDG